eukprot:XP_014791215.1 PREDICTED: putative uncharacterized protein DDB_G0282133 [Octopus bimaculoides]
MEPGLVTDTSKNFEGNKQMLSELKEKFNSLQKEMHKLKPFDCGHTGAVCGDHLDYSVTSPPPNLPSKDDEIARIISEMALPIMLSPIPSEHNEEDDENSFCSLPDQNSCDDGSVDHFAEMLETEFLKGVDADTETNKVQGAVMLPNDNSCHLLQSPQKEDHLQVNHYQTNENGINATTIVCDKNSESGNGHANAEQGCMKKDLEDENSKQLESVPDTAIRTDVIQINDTELLPRSANINSGDVSSSDSVTYHSVAYNYTDTTPSHGETLLNDKINTNPPVPRKRSNLLDENLKKSKENKEQDITSESLVEYQNDNDNKCDVKCGYNSDCSKADSNKILQNHIAKDFSQTADNSKFGSVTFLEDAYNNTETLSVCGVMSLENEIDANLSAQRKCSDLSEGTLKMSKDRKKRNFHKESLAKNQNDNDRNKSNTMCGENSDYNKMNSKEVLGNHIEENSSETVDFKIEPPSAKIPAITKDLSAADLRSTISETLQLTPPPHHQNHIINSHHSQNNSQTLDTENFKDENPAVKNILDDKSLLHEFSLSKDDKSSNLSLFFNKSGIKLNNSETHFNNSETKVNNLETKVNDSETEFNNSEIKFSNSETKFSNLETKVNNSETKFSNSETQFNDLKTKFNNPETRFNNPETQFNNPETKFNNPETIFNNPETKFNNPETKSNSPETKLNNPETKSNSPETKFNNPETIFNNPEAKFNNPETKSNSPATKFNNPETIFNSPEAKFNSPETKFNSPETKFNSPETKFNNPETKFNSPETIFNNPEAKFNSPATKFNNPETKFNNPETKFNSPKLNLIVQKLNLTIQKLNLIVQKLNLTIHPATIFNNPETKFNNPKTIFNNPEAKFNSPETKFNNPETKFNSPETKFNNPETKFNNPETKFNSPETKFNNPATIFNDPATIFNNPETKFNNPETKFNNPETKFNNPATKFNNPATIFNNPATIFNNPETIFNNPETIFNNPETIFNNPETKFNDSEIKFHNSKERHTISASLPKISETVIANNELEDLNDRTSLVSNEPAALKLQEKVFTEINNGNTSSEEFNDFSDDSLDLDYNTSKKVGFQRNLVEYVANGETKEGDLIKIEHSYALETMNNEDSLIFSDSLSEQEIDSSSAKCYTTKPKSTTSINDLFGICSSDSESEKQFSNSDIPLKSVNNSDRTETSTNSDDPNSQMFPVKLKELQSEEKTMPEDKNRLIRCDSFNTSLDVDDNNGDSQMPNFSIETNMEHKKDTATGTACGDIKENGKPSQKVEEAPCIRTNFVNNKPSSHIKCSVTFLQHSTSLLDSIKSKNEAVENGKNDSVSSKQLGIEQVFGFCHNTEESQSENIANDTTYPKIFARESNETASSNDILTLIEEFILVAPLITPFPDTLEFIKKHSSHTDTVNSKFAVAQISIKSSVENTLPPHLSINFRKRPTENSILPINSSGNKNHVNSHDGKYPDEPVLKSNKQTPEKVFNLSHNSSSDENVPSKISATFAHRRKLLNKSRSLNRSHHHLLSKKTGQLKEFKKESHITAFQTTEKLTRKQVQFESISDLKLKKAEEIKKCFVKAGEVIGDNSVTTSESKPPETSNVDIICKSVSQKKHKRLNIDKTSEDSTEEQLPKRQCKENRVIAEKNRSASHKVERELVNYWKSISSPPSGTIEKIFNSRLEPALVINSLVLQIVKLLEASQHEMVQWYYIHSNAGQPTPYLSEKETRLFHLISVLNDRPDVNDFIPKLCDSIQKAVYNYGKESNHLGRWSLCRVYIALCRLQGQLSTARIFFYNILCQLPSPQYMLFALTVSATWPLVLTFNREGGHVTLPQVIEHVVVNSIKGKHVDKKILRCLHKLCGWTLQAESRKNEVPRQLLAQLQGCLDATMSRDDTFRLMKGIELLSLQENWSWTNSLIRNRIGPLLKKYLSVEEPSESVTTVLSFILEMLGNLYLHGQTRDKTACYAVNYLLKPLLASKKVPQQINLCCANVLLKLFPFDPGTVYPTLEIWLSENPTEITSSLAETWATIKHKINNFKT